MNNDFLQKVNEEISVEENTQLTDPDKMELAPEVRAALIDEILDLHHEYEYKSTTYSMDIFRRFAVLSASGSKRVCKDSKTER